MSVFCRLSLPSSRNSLFSVLLVSLLLLGGCKLETRATEGGSVSVSVSATRPCSAHAGFNCGFYLNNQVLEVIATANPGYEFTGWEGDCKGLGFCNLKMNADHSVLAHFTRTELLALHDTDSTLETVLEQGKLEGSCDRWARNPDSASVYLEKMCGKWMFFYEGFNIMGVPAAIAEFMTTQMPDTVGKGFSKFGLIADPYSKTNLPLGLAPGATVAGAKTLSFTCASCHFGQTPDGRFSAGLANHNYDYGKQIIALNFLSSMVMLPAPMTNNTIDEETQRFMQPLLDELNQKQLKPKLMMAAMPLIGLLMSGKPIPTIPKEVQKEYLAWKKGTQDFVITPVGQDDHVHTVSKMLTLWDLYTEEAMQAAGGAHAMLGFTGSTTSYEEFLQGFVALSNGNYPTIRLRALKTYLLSLKSAPSNLPLNAADVETGQALFNSVGCSSCHDGPSLSSTRTFSYEEIGTDAAMQRWADPDLTGHSVVPSVFDGVLTHQIKAPRLVGMWAQKRFLHNGSVDSLEDLFCLNHPRPTRTDEPFGDQGH
ncbi:MAG TPA: hypothetical protein VFM46_18195, partial [Pseudomonadales bacterium]|nr:hypothetical protein [Pseudomonadales bacterium]